MSAFAFVAHAAFAARRLEPRGHTPATGASLAASQRRSSMPCCPRSGVATCRIQRRCLAPTADDRRTATTIATTTSRLRSIRCASTATTGAARQSLTPDAQPDASHERPAQVPSLRKASLAARSALVRARSGANASPEAQLPALRQPASRCCPPHRRGRASGCAHPEAEARPEDVPAGPDARSTRRRQGRRARRRPEIGRTNIA